MDHRKTFDIIVIGGGHAGTEAALVAARMGADVLLLTHSLETIGQMSCNPAIGGIGKGHLVKEIDALGGVMAWAADKSCIQFRCLNASKGPAVRATRAQADRNLYRLAIQHAVHHQPGLQVFQQAVDALILEGEQVRGVVTASGLSLRARCVVLATGTFLGGRVHIGDKSYAAGRAGDAPCITLAKQLRELPLRVERLKTGTPPRLDRRSIDFSRLKAQPGDEPRPVFSHRSTRSTHPRQVACHITHTNARSHEIIRSNLGLSPLYSGEVDSKGPRYCPSIEDKIRRFADKDQHQIFVEPEGLDSCEIYPNGISTSMPFEVQVAFIRSIVGFERANIVRPGYVIEYDFFDPRDLKPSLESKFLGNLFLAGQINGTTGYEEAAAAGLLAGLNAVRKIRDLEPWSPGRDEAYMGVMMDDLTTRGAIEPYRMFTSRAEFRLLLREDNADLRLTEQGWQLGIVDEAHYRAVMEKRERIEQEKQRLKACWIQPGTPAAQQLAAFEQPLTREYNVFELLRRPQNRYSDLVLLPGVGCPDLAQDVVEQVEIQAKYQGYIERAQQEADKQRRHEHTTIPDTLDFSLVPGLSNEVKELLLEHRPQSIGQASRIPGVTPAAISLLLVHLHKRAHAA